jgi:hypothetical protein
MKLNLEVLMSSKLPQVTIDLPIVLDPFKMATIISGIETQFSEIVVPDSLRFIELWGKDSGIPLTRTVSLFDKDENLKSEAIYKFFKFSPGVVSPKNFIAGLNLFRMAYEYGMVSVVPMGRYWPKGKKALQTSGYYFDSLSYEFPGGSVYINPDNTGFQMESIIGIATELNAVPIFGDTAFVDWVSKNEPLATLFGENGNLVIKTDLQEILYLKEPPNINEFFFFARNHQMVKGLCDKLGQLKAKSEAKKSMALNTLEFGATNAIDNACFSGVPVTGAVVYGYKLIKSWLSLKS